MNHDLPTPAVAVVDPIVVVGIHPSARRLAAALGCPRIDDRSDLPSLAEGSWWLAWRDDRLELGATHPGAPRTGLSVDFVAGPLGRRLMGGFGARDPFARAIGGPTTPASGRLVDATAGLGRDTILAAHLGHRVLAVERSPVLVALVEDGLRRASSEPRLAPLVERIELRCAEARDVLLAQRPADDPGPSVVYLDPMFPESSGSARVKKPMQLLQRLVGAEAGDAAALPVLQAALACADRVVVKRPAHAPALAGSRSPTTAVRGGRTTRYDVYVGP